jgi:hypothetical protein
VALAAPRRRVLGVAAALIACALAVAGAIRWAMAEERAAAQALLQDKAAQLAGEVDAELLRTVATLKALAVSTPLERGDLAGFHELAARVVAADPRWENVQLIDAKGGQLVNVRLPFGAPLPPLNRPDLPLRAALTRQPVVSDVAMGVVARRMLTAVYFPVLQDGTVKYVITAAIEPPNWQKMLRSSLPPGMDAALLDRYAFVITNTYDAAPGTASPALRSLLPTEPGDLTGNLSRADESGERPYHAVQKAGFSGWTVVTFMQQAPAHARWRGRWASIAAAALALLAAGAGIGWLLARRGPAPNGGS